MKRSASLRSIFCLAAIATFLSGISARGQELVANGGFESSTGPTDFSGWTLDDLSFPYAQNMGMDPVFAQRGNRHANLAGDPGPDSMSQILNTNAGDTYTFSFWLAHDMTMSLDNTFQVLWDGTPILALTNDGVHDYVKFSFSRVATGPSTAISFVYRDGDDYFRLDDVSVTAAVPERSTIAFVIVGLGLVAPSLRAKARRAA